MPRFVSVPEVALVLNVLRANRRQALLVGAAYAVVVWSSTAGYLSAYRSGAQRFVLQATLGQDRGLAALFGTPRTLATPGGFTAWRSIGVLVIVGAVWGAFTGTRILRGEEEDGRIDL